MIAKIIETHDACSLGGYDIGCSFEGTVKNSSLGELYESTGTRLCVNAFHGYSHSYLCQLQYHPNIIEGIGLEDLETMERIFSSSNQLASVIRYASRYRRRLFIEAYFKQWDADKYQNLGIFLLRNYKQALAMIEEDTRTLDEAKLQFGLTDADMDLWEQEERTFFSHLGEEEEYDIQAMTYVELLQQLRELSDKRSQATDRLFHLVDSSTVEDYDGEKSATDKAEKSRQSVIDRYDRLDAEISQLETQMNIDREHRWTPANPKYVEAEKYMHERKYRHALDKLQKLVVLRLFELHKLNLSHTGMFSQNTIIYESSFYLPGYKMRTHLSKSLQTRCKTIKKAVTAYNAAAAALSPPRPPVDWSAVSHYGFLDDFHLLQDTRHDVRSKRWAQPIFRNLMKVRNRLARAKEELVRCNVEIRRLHTSIRDEHAHFQTTLSTLTGTSIYGAVEEFAIRRHNINQAILDRIFQIYELPGFTGNKQCGTRVGGVAPRVADPVPSAPIFSGADDDNSASEDEDDVAEDEEVVGDIGGIIQFVTHL